MTREEAALRLRGIYDGVDMDCLLMALQNLGILKFDESKTPAQDLQERLRNLMVEIDWRPFMGLKVEIDWRPFMGLKDKDQIAGRVSVYGAGCIIDFIHQQGFEIVRK